jgi:hypothetical protein
MSWMSVERKLTVPFLAKYKPQLSVEDIEEILGIEKFDEEIAEKTRYISPFSTTFHHLFLSFGLRTATVPRAFKTISRNFGRVNC